MLRKRDIESRLSLALSRDVRENPKMVLEFASTKEGIQSALKADAEAAIHGHGGPVLFPHVRGAIKDILAISKSDIWMATGEYMGQTTTTTTPAAPKGTFEVIGDIFGGLLNAGAAIWSTKITADAEKAKLQQLQAQQSLAVQTAALQQQATRPAQAGLFGMDMTTMLLMGGIGLAAIIIPPLLEKKGKKR